MRQTLNCDYWNSVSTKISSHHLEENVAIYKRNEHIKLIEKWCGSLEGKKILKTDLYEEAFGEDCFLPWISKQHAKTFGIDISYNITKNARSRLRQSDCIFNNCIASDIRKCAFKDDSFDLIISNSTLDNLIPHDVPDALSELKRILKPKGILILTLDNGNNPLYSLGYFIEKLLKLNGYYQGRCYSVTKARSLVSQCGFTIRDMTAIVHIITPFNKLALLLRKTNIKFFKRLVSFIVSLCSRLANKRTKFLTGWFIALKLEK